MIKDITIGQFYNVDSVIHRLDPRVKLMITFVYVISLFVTKGVFPYVLAFVTLIGYIMLSRVPMRYILKGLKAITFLLLFTVLINVFTVRGVHNVVEWKFIKISDVGLQSGIYLGLRIAFMVIGSSMMTYTTTPTQLTDGLEKMLGVLKKIHIPVHEFAMIMSIALRFIPVLVEELDKIMKAQMARGVDFSEGNLLSRLKKYMPIIIPLFVSAIRRSEELAQAMDARCYHGGDGRTKMKPLSYQRRDVIAYMVMFVYLGAMIALQIIF